jgi:DNA modification methylase
MKPYYEDSAVQIFHGDCRDILPSLPKVDLVLTDPPYELGFMGKEWDKQGISYRYETWQIIMDSCKPGAMMLAFGGTRTWHRIAVAIEDAGWEIRDTLMWLYGQGFPKSLDISKAIDKMKGAEREVIAETPSGGFKRLMQTNKEAGFRPDDYYPDGNKFTSKEPITPEAQLWSGYGTALKPAFEPIILAMKPLDGTFAENALKHGVAGLNIDGSRIPIEDNAGVWGTSNKTCAPTFNASQGQHEFRSSQHPRGRYPANLILDEEAGQMLDEQSGASKSTGGRVANISRTSQIYGGGKGLGQDISAEDVRGDPGFGDTGGASRFFYCAKASKKERDRGCEDLEDRLMARSGGAQQAEKDGKDEYLQNHIGLNRISKVKNDHPTVKPLALMEYLCNLLKPPTGGVLIDPFMGSGTTLRAAKDLGRKAIGIEIEERYCEIAAKRMSQSVLGLTTEAECLNGDTKAQQITMV